MGTVRPKEFRKDAVRIALSLMDQKMIRGIIFFEDGLSRRQIADDHGVGMSTLNKWITAHRDTDVVSPGHCDAITTTGLHLPRRPWQPIQLG